jgi:uncharacterized protein (DUF1684 family)
MRRTWAALAVLSLAVPGPAGADAAYTKEVGAWRAAREERLKAPGGWLSVVGLTWLKEGSNTVGSDRTSDVVLPAPAPAKVAVIDLAQGKASVTVESGVKVTSKDAPVTAMALRPDTAKDGPDVLTFGSLSFFVIERGGRYAIRLKDDASPRRKQFTGLKWFPVREDYRVVAKFEPHPMTKRILIPTFIGTEEEMVSPGFVTFELNGVKHRLEPVLEESDAKELFFIFKDLTSGKETYPAGRFLYTPLPKDGTVTIDFNKAYSPPCAFTAFATCPLPPKQNRMETRVEAGEKRPAGSH